MRTTCKYKRSLVVTKPPIYDLTLQFPFSSKSLLTHISILLHTLVIVLIGRRVTASLYNAPNTIRGRLETRCTLCLYAHFITTVTNRQTCQSALRVHRYEKSGWF